MSASIGTTLARRLVLLFAIALPLGLLGVQELILHAQRLEAQRIAIQEAEVISAEMAAQHREEVRLYGATRPWIEYFAGALHGRDGVAKADRDFTSKCEWQRNPTIYLLFHEGRLYRKLIPAEAPILWGSTFAQFDRSRIEQRARPGVPQPIAFPFKATELNRLCLEESGDRLRRLSLRAVGGIARLPDGSGEFVVARIVQQDRFANLTVLAWGAALVTALMLATLLVTSRFNRAILSRINRMSAVLAVVERDGFASRVPGEGAAEIIVLADAINMMIDRISEAQGHLSRINAYVAHNLRTPVKIVQDLVDGIAPNMAGDQVEDIDEVRRQLRELQRRCNQLLLVTRLETEARTLVDRTDLAGVAERLIEDIFDYAAEARDITITRSLEPAMVRGREDLLEMVIDNALQNALKFADPGSTVTTSVIAGDGEARLEIANRGPEVSVALRETIFALGVTTGGHGLGLHMVRTVARRLGGDAWAADEPGGFRLVLRLPLVS